jgi:hypothetical protein
MKKIILGMTTVVALMGSIFTANVFAAKAVKIDICHQTGNGNYIILNVSENAAAAHYASSSIGHDDPETWVPVGGGSCEPGLPQE